MSRESGLAQAVRLMNEPRTDIKISHNSTCRKHMTVYSCRNAVKNQRQTKRPRECSPHWLEVKIKGKKDDVQS